MDAMGFFSLPTITALIDAITGGAGNQSTPPICIYRSGNALEMFFGVEQVADPREYIPQPERLDAVVEHLNARLRKDGYELRRIDECYRLVELGMNAPVANALAEAARLLNLESVSRDFERAIQQADVDPEDAITSACSTVESVCKCLLDHMNVPYPTIRTFRDLCVRFSGIWISLLVRPTSSKTFGRFSVG